MSCAHDVHIFVLWMIIYINNNLNKLFFKDSDVTMTCKL